MKASYKWLQEYFDQPLPSAEKVAEALTFHAFEVEGIDKKEGDTILDVKVLPDRACYALSHRGLAYEISAILDIPLKEKEYLLEYPISQILELDIQDDRCIRDSKLVMQNIAVSPSPSWLKEKLEMVGQRSINNIVDATNYVMLDMGQPLHAFDLGKLSLKNGKAKIVLKKARAGEQITLLAGKTVILDEDTLIFADANNGDLPLDIAGIKGGIAAEVDASTKDIIVLSANFDATYIRKTATKLGIRTDAAKRSENRISPELTLKGLAEVADIILRIGGASARVEGLVDHYPHKKDQLSFLCSQSILTAMLGVPIPSEEVESIFRRLKTGCENVDGVYKLTPPFYRLDLASPQDIVEEVGRIYGYEKIPVVIPRVQALPSKEQDRFGCIRAIKELLASYGFSEVFTYSLVSEGEVEIEKSVASDKNFLRSNLSDGILKSLELNFHHAAFLELDKISVFEIGNVFTKAGEHTSLAIGIKHARKIKGKGDEQGENEDIRKTRELLLKALDIDIVTLCTVDDTGGLMRFDGKQIGIINSIDGIMELNLDALIPHVKVSAQERLLAPAPNIIYKPFSAYPFIARDMAVFVPEAVKPEEVEVIIKENGTELLLKHRLFDTFKKDGKISYAFRMIFQSFERTLTDEEVNAVMGIMVKKVVEKGWEVR